MTNKKPDYFAWMDELTKHCKAEGIHHMPAKMYFIVKGCYTAGIHPYLAVDVVRTAIDAQKLCAIEPDTRETTE